MHEHDADAETLGRESRTLISEERDAMAGDRVSLSEMSLGRAGCSGAAMAWWRPRSIFRWGDPATRVTLTSWPQHSQHGHEARHEDDGPAGPGWPQSDPAHWPQARVTCRDPPPTQGEVSHVRQYLDRIIDHTFHLVKRLARSCLRGMSQRSMLSCFLFEVNTF